MKRDEVIATLRAHERELKDLGVLRVAVFGSVARGDDRGDSDVDLVVAFDEGQRHSLVDVARVHRTLSTLLRAEVDLAVEPLQTARFRAHVEQDLVRAF
jgi:predicted nucleotidyltransferase